MLKKSLLIAIAAAALGACSAAAQDSLAAVEPASAMPTMESASLDTAPAAYEAPAATCDVRARRTENGVLIQGRALADTDIHGEYELSIVTSGANQSEINQAGDVTIAAGRQAIFGESEIGFSRGSRLRAELKVRDADGLICRDTLNL